MREMALFLCSVIEAGNWNDRDGTVVNAIYKGILKAVINPLGVIRSPENVVIHRHGPI